MHNPIHSSAYLNHFSSKFEYIVDYGVRTKILATRLNEMGAEGWELVSASDTTDVPEKYWEDKDTPEDSRILFFKREKK